MKISNEGRVSVKIVNTMHREGESQEASQAYIRIDCMIVYRVISYYVLPRITFRSPLTVRLVHRVAVGHATCRHALQWKCAHPHGLTHRVSCPCVTAVTLIILRIGCYVI
jgi:hypothetical protein